MFVTVYLMLLQIPRGLGQTLCSFMGFELGRGKVEVAYSHMWHFLKLGAGLLCLELFLFIIFALSLKGFANNPQSLSSEFNVLSFMVIAFSFCQILLFGAIRALNLLHQAFFVSFTASVCLVMPLSYVFVYKLNMRMTSNPPASTYTDGIHLALLMGFSLQTLLFSLILFTKDWTPISKNFIR